MPRTCSRLHRSVDVRYRSFDRIHDHIQFWRGGYWFEGSVAAVGGTLSAAYLPRSSIGRIDTDQMNLGFLYLLFWACLSCGQLKDAGRGNHLGLDRQWYR